MQGSQKSHIGKSSGPNKHSKAADSEPGPQSEEIGKSIIQALPIGIVIFDADLKIVGANPAASGLIELGGRIDESLAKGTAGVRSGYPNWGKQLRTVLSRGDICKFDSVGYTRQHKARSLRLTCVPFGAGAKGKSPGGAVIIEDTTESTAIQERLAGAERLAAIGKVASKVAHDLNDPIDGILRYINLALRSLEQENLDKPKEYLEQCRKGLLRMVRIVSELLEFSRGTLSPPESVEIEQIIEDAVKAMETKVGASNIQVVRDYAKDMPRISSDNLFQVFCNLIKNAFDAMPDGGKLVITTRPAKDMVVAKFRDTGVGLPAEGADAIFQPFFSTKSLGRGTGLGLAICKDIVERCDGYITAENAPGGGSIFTVCLPVRCKIERDVQESGRDDER